MKRKRTPVVIYDTPEDVAAYFDFASNFADIFALRVDPVGSEVAARYVAAGIIHRSESDAYSVGYNRAANESASLPAPPTPIPVVRSDGQPFSAWLTALVNPANPAPDATEAAA